MEKIKIHGIYKHFRGNLYIVEDIALSSETNEKMVIYRALYDDGQLWCRPYNMFLETLDRNKYPDSNQKHRFELQNIESVTK